MEIQVPGWLLPLLKITLYSVGGYLAVCVVFAKNVWGSLAALFQVTMSAPFVLFYVLVLNLLGAGFGRIAVHVGIPAQYAGAAFVTLATGWLVAQGNSAHYKGIQWPEWVPWTFPVMLLVAWLWFYPTGAQ